MSTTVDQRVVEMQFDNKRFESNVQTSLGTLDKLKQGLNLQGAARGLEEVNSAAKGCNLSPLGNAVETVRMKFSALQVMAVTALSNITNSAVNAGRRLVSALTIEPIRMGLQEYETQINAVQTILANTKSKGTTIDQVNSALDELNHYADKTIYNFTEMTRNIGTFTAAGIDLDTSVNAIQGIANLAAVSGSTSQQASTAMYQLSQALASGTVKLMDWNSVVNAGMGGQVFQDALKKTSEELNTGAEAAIKANGSFRESLQTGWLTSEVLTETLKKFTTSGANEYVAEYTGLSKEAVQAELDKAEATYGEAEAIEYASKALAEKSGKNADEIKQALEFARTAEDAATKVKTFSQLIDTLKEALQSGWTQSWEIIIGDFEEAKELWTSVSDYFSDAINKSAEARNNLLQAWKDGGGRDMLFEGIKNAFQGILSVIKPIKEAFRDIFPPVTAKNLLTITERFRDFTKNLILSEERAKKVKSVFKGLFSILDIGKKALTAILKPLLSFVTGDSAGSIADKILDIAASIGDFFTRLNEGTKAGEGFSKVSEIISKALDGIGKGVSSVIGSFDGIGNALVRVWTWIKTIAGKIGNVLGKVFNWIKENISASDIFAGLAGGGIFVAFKKFGDLADKINDIFSKLNKKDSIVSSFKELLGGVKETLSSFQEGIKVGSILSIAIAITLLSSSLRKISEIKADKVAYSLTTIALLMKSLTSGFSALAATLKKFGGKGTIQAGIAMMGIAVAVRILASAMVKLQGLSFGEIIKGLAGVGGSVLILVKAMQKIGKGEISLKTSVAMLALAESCKIMADALVKFGSMSWDEIGRGLAAMGGALFEFTLIMVALDKFSGKDSIFSAIAIFIASKSLDGIAEALQKFGSMTWEEIDKGLKAMGNALAELGIVIAAVGKIAGWSSLIGAGAIDLVILCLDKLSDALIKFGSMSWDEIGRGLTAMGGALLEIGAISGALGMIAGLSGLLGAATIDAVILGLNKLSDALIKFGSMSWDEVGRGLTAMGGALLEIGIVTGALGYLTNIAGLVGAGTIALAVQGLDKLANALIKFGSMSWDEIGRGLTAMGAALGELALGSIMNTLGVLGSMSIENAAAPLGILADSFKKFCGMNWEEVSVGIKAMAAVLGELAVGGFINTISILGSASISIVAEPLGVLADSVKKWIGMTIPENLTAQLAQLAGAVSSFTFSGIGASGLATVAAPLGTLADSVRKWANFTVPDGLNEKLESLAKGIKAFSFAFMGGWSISAVVGPLGNLADSVRKWAGVGIPISLKGGLESLAKGVEAFSFCFMGGWSLNAITGPLCDLASSVKKWTGVTVPANLEENLSKLADAIGEFTIWDAVKISGVAGPLGTLATAVRKLSGITVDGTKLKTFVGNVKSCITDLSGFTSSSISGASSTIDTLVGIIKKVNETKTGNVIGFVKAANHLNKIDINDISVDSKGLSSAVTAVSNAMKSMKTAMSNSKSSLTSGMKTAMSGVSSAISDCSSSAVEAIRKLIEKLIKAIADKKASIKSAFKNVASNGITGVREKYSSMYNAGVYLGQGLIRGIESKKTAVYNAAFKLGQEAVKGEKDGQKSQSPSKLTIQSGKWFGEGLVIGIESMGKAVYNAGHGMGETAVMSISKSISKVGDLVSNGIDAQPTIRPVLDLSNVSSGARTINGMFGMRPSVGLMTNVGTINSMMNGRQNGDTNEILLAIKDLKSTIQAQSGDTYNINGITYDDGSNISEAIQSLIRGVRMERRI